VKMLEEGTAGLKSRASEPFHTEVLEHVAELQRSDPAVRAALVEVGGLEELLGLIEQESEIKPSGTAREKQLVLVEVGIQRQTTTLPKVCALHSVSIIIGFRVLRPNQNYFSETQSCIQMHSMKPSDVKVLIWTRTIPENKVAYSGWVEMVCG
jgi:hypothetical protein